MNMTNYLELSQVNSIYCILNILKNTPSCFFFSNHVFMNCSGYFWISKRVFGSVVAVAFQIAFRAEIHANDVFSFFKNHF
jgi:hypothetical protein